MKTVSLANHIPANNIAVAQSPEVKEFARAEKSENTLRAYRADNQILFAWCHERGYRPLPLAAGQLAEFLASQVATGVKAMTLVRRVAAIRHAHRAKDMPDPFDQAARATLAGIRNKLGVRVDPKRPLLAAELVTIIEAIPFDLTVQPTPRAADYRDRALLLLGFAGALRRSELAGLDVADLRFCKEGVRVTIRKSKTDQAGAGQDIAVPMGSTPETCPIEALQAWLRWSNIQDGPLFRRLHLETVGSERLEASTVALILKRRAKAAGLDAEVLGAHSLRSGFLTSAAMAGANLFKMMDQSRHRSVETVRRYVRDANLFKDNAAKGLL